VSEKARERVHYPGIHTVTDGSGAAVWVEKHGSQGACVYPITPSTNMGVEYAAAAGDGFKNLWGEPIVFLEPESEHSSASAAEGFASAGGRVTNFTSGQGLVLMKEVLFAISGKRLPAVFHVGSRALTSHSLNVHAGHDDVMAVADTGWGILFASNAQEVADLALISRRAAENSHTPFLCCQDGFLTTHTIETVRLPELPFMKEFLGDPKQRVPCLMDPHHPVMSGVVQNQDSYMKGKVAQRFFTDRVLGFVREAMKSYGAATGRRLSPVQSYRMEDAEVAILTIGSMAETLRATVDWTTQNTDLRVGAVQLLCFRPFPAADLVRALSGVRAVAVIARLDDPLAGSSLLTAEVKAAFADALSGRLGMPRLSRMPRIHSGIAGLGSRDVRPGHFIAAAKNLYERGKRDFVLGVEHELALPVQLDPDVRPPGAFSMRGYSVGGFGSVATNKIIATVTANLFDLHVQAYPFYGSEKKGLPTRYFLTVADQPIRKHCELHHVEFVPLSALASFNLGNPLDGIAKGGAVFVQTGRTDPDEVWWQVPPYARGLIRDLDLRLFYADAAGIAAEVSTREDLRVRMQGIVLLGVFLRAAPFVTERRMDRDTLMDAVKQSLTRYFGKAGERVVEENLICVQRGYDEVREVPRDVMEEEETEQRRAILERRVADLMTEGAVTCRPDAPLAEVHDLLSERQISCVVVVDDEGEMAGLLSTTDLARAQSLSARMDRGLPELLAEHLMTPEVLTTHPEESLADAVDRLVSNRVHRLVVTKEQEPKRPIGILSLTDLATAGPMVE